LIFMGLDFKAGSSSKRRFQANGFIFMGMVIGFPPCWVDSWWESYCTPACAERAGLF
jgi:hypothetical protein